MTRVHGYYWVKFADDPQPQIVMIHIDGTVWVFGEPHGQYIAGEEPEHLRGQGLSLEILSGPLIPPEIPALEAEDFRPLGRT
jgi:hypothetical protein